MMYSDGQAANLGADNPYFPQSPPDRVEGVRIAERMASMTASDDPNISPMADANKSSARSIASTSTAASTRPYASKVGILPSSLPGYHKVFMEREKAEAEGRHVPDSSVAAPAPSAPPRTPAEQEEPARRLKPHSRGSQLRLDESGKRPQGLTPVNPPRKSKPVRWQFGIRSRNAPWEALLCIYKALHKLDATWMVDEDDGKIHEQDDDEMGDRGEDDGEEDSPRRRGRDDDPTGTYKLPADPWFIKTRWTTDSKRRPRLQNVLSLMALPDQSHRRALEALGPDWLGPTRQPGELETRRGSRGSCHAHGHPAVRDGQRRLSGRLQG